MWPTTTSHRKSKGSPGRSASIGRRWTAGSRRRSRCSSTLADPYSRVDALRSDRSVRIELEGAILAESSRTVMVFETGLPTRYYFDRLDVHFDHLRPSETVTSCPYKGTTSAYWSAAVGESIVPDIAWAYDFPTRQVAPIAGLVAFYNEKVDVTVDGTHLERPDTHFS